MQNKQGWFNRDTITVLVVGILTWLVTWWIVGATFWWTLPYALGCAFMVTVFIKLFKGEF